MRITCAFLLLVCCSAIAADINWPAYGGQPEGTRYSPLKQINKSNVARLKEAWRYDTSDVVRLGRAIALRT